MSQHITIFNKIHAKIINIYSKYTLQTQKNKLYKILQQPLTNNNSNHYIVFPNIETFYSTITKINGTTYPHHRYEGLFVPFNNTLMIHAQYQPKPATHIVVSIRPLTDYDKYRFYLQN
jgi:hypothetical protein